VPTNRLTLACLVSRPSFGHTRNGQERRDLPRIRYSTLIVITLLHARSG
jgi:hypothetical protein